MLSMLVLYKLCIEMRAISDINERGEARFTNNKN